MEKSRLRHDGGIVIEEGGRAAMNRKRTHGALHGCTAIFATIFVILSVGGTGVSLPSTGYIVGPGDVLEISVFGYPELTREIAIGPDGKAVLPLIGSISTGGASIEGLTGLLTRAYAEYIINPRVMVSIKEFRKVRASMLGQVTRPGAYELPLGSRLLDLIAVAGGPTDAAALKGAQLLRPGQPPVAVDLTRVMAGEPSLNMPLNGGETLVIPEDLTGFVTIQGEVARPGRYRLKGDMRVVDALLAAGGLTDRASVAQASLVHASNEQEPLNLDALLLHQEMSYNVPLQPGDILFIPEEINNKIYVIGDVKNPGVFTLKGQVTLLQAIAMAGGPEQRGPATAKSAYVVRRPGNHSQEIQAGPARVSDLPNGGTLITADLSALMNDPSKDVAVQPGDVVVIPQTGLGGLQVIANILGGFASVFWFLK
jgi:polysaccharide biosynthesis/export protein